MELKDGIFKIGEITVASMVLAINPAKKENLSCRRERRITVYLNRGGMQSQSQTRHRKVIFHDHTTNKL